ncbi:MAG: hypothetical protein H0W50_06770 [Parachlamydiaceae bacterium]|nr:hypothetical protein [Parachlamydiaceae bacterium]
MAKEGVSELLQKILNCALAISALTLFAGVNFSGTGTHLFAEIPQFALNEFPPMNKIYHPVSTTKVPNRALTGD